MVDITESARNQYSRDSRKLRLWLYRIAATFFVIALLGLVVSFLWTGETGIRMSDGSRYVWRLSHGSISFRHLSFLDATTFVDPDSSRTTPFVWLPYYRSHPNGPLFAAWQKSWVFVVPLWMVNVVLFITAHYFKRSLPHLARNAHECRKCGYNLSGNTSGRCPECGTNICAENT